MVGFMEICTKLLKICFPLEGVLLGSFEVYFMRHSEGPLGVKQNSPN
jgi:hypothetical protein